MAVKKNITRSPEFSDSVIDTIREPLIALDHDLRVVNASRSFYKFFKVNPEETVGQLIYDLGNKQWDIPKLRELLETILPDKTTFDDYEVEHNFAAIGKRIMLLNARQIQRESGKERIILLAIEDITERKQLEELLAESEERYRRLFETASDGIVLLEKSEGKITHANPATEKMLGYNKKESIGNKLQDIGISLDKNDFQTTMQNLNKIGILNYDDVPVKTKSGQHIDTDIYLVDRARLVQCNIRDITERKQAEESIRQSEGKYRAIIENIEDGYYEVDLKGNFTFFNDSMCRILGYSKVELMGMNNRQITDKENARIVFQAFNKVYNTGEPTKEFDWQLIRKDGTKGYIEQSASLIKDSSGNLIGFRGIIHDITERKQQEEELLRTNKLLNSIVENIPDMIFLKDSRELRFVRFNRAGEDLLGHSREELLGKSDYDLFPHEQAELFTKKDREVLHSKELVDIEEEFIQTRNKGERILHTKKVPILNEDGEPGYLLGISEDITERKLVEAKLLETLNRLKKAVDTTIQVMISAIEVRDPYTAGHQIRSADLASAIATEMGLDQLKIDGIKMAGSIHDIGKLSIPSEILSKPTKLTDIEFSLIKEHSLIGYEILKTVESPWPLAQIVYQHHERMNGSGYPRNLKGDEILMDARIMAVADVVEAMASHRPYRPALGIDAALEEIEKNKGILYDNIAADACLRLFRKNGYTLNLKKD